MLPTGTSPTALSTKAPWNLHFWLILSSSRPWSTSFCLSFVFMCILEESRFTSSCHAGAQHNVLPRRLFKRKCLPFFLHIPPLILGLDITTSGVATGERWLLAGPLIGQHFCADVCRSSGMPEMGIGTASSNLTHSFAPWAFHENGAL